MLSTTIDNILIDPCIMNSSGPKSTTKHQISNLDKNIDIGAVVSKTCTNTFKEGNSYPSSYYDNIGSINSVGLENMGFEYYTDIKIKKPYIISVLPDKHIFENNKINNADLIEVNLSCPNIKSIDNEESIRQIAECFDGKFGIKISPVLDDIDIYFDKKISFITCCNTMKNGLIINENGDFRVSKKFGGIGGSYIKPFSLSTVYRLNKETNIPIIGCGGINNSQDIIDYIRCGASAVQIGTHFFQNDDKVFKILSDDLKIKLNKMKFKNILNLKYISKL